MNAFAGSIGMEGCEDIGALAKIRRRQKALRRMWQAANLPPDPDLHRKKIKEDSHD